MLKAYRALDWDAAERLIGQCLELDTPKTRLRAYYRVVRERIMLYREHPPPSGWDGVFIATSK